MGSTILSKSLNALVLWPKAPKATVAWKTGVYTAFHALVALNRELAKLPRQRNEFQDKGFVLICLLHFIRSEAGFKQSVTPSNPMPAIPI